MANVFDQFDAQSQPAPSAGANPFDQFDAPANVFDQFDDGPGFTTPFKAAARGIGEGVGAVISGIGASMAGTQNQALQGFDAVDQGKAPDYGQMNPGAYNAVKDYQKASPEDRIKLRAAQKTMSGLGQHVQTGGEDVTKSTQGAIPLTPGEQGSLVAKVPEMVGYGVPAVAAMVATRGRGASTVLGTGAGVMAAQGADQGFQDAIAHGASLDDAYKSAYGSMQIQGGLGALPAGYVLDRLNSMTGGMVSRVLVGAASQAGTQGVVGAVQQMLMNLQAKGLYDPQRGIGDNVSDTAILSALAGGTTGAALGVLPGAKSGVAAPPAGETTAGPPSAPVLPDHLMPSAGDVVGLTTKGGAPQRVTVSGVQDGHVFFTDEAGVTRGTTVADFTRDLTTPPEPQIDTKIISAAAPDRIRVPEQLAKEPTHVAEGPPLEAYGDVFGRNDVEAPPPNTDVDLTQRPLEGYDSRPMARPADHMSDTEIADRGAAAAKAAGLPDPGAKIRYTAPDGTERTGTVGTYGVRQEGTGTVDPRVSIIDDEGFTTYPMVDAARPRSLSDIAGREHGLLADRGSEPVQPRRPTEVLPRPQTAETPVPRIQVGDTAGAEERPVVAGDNERGNATSSGDGTAASPIIARTAADIDQAAAQVAKPTEAQKESGNYQKGHVNVQGLNIAIETPKGSERSGVGPDGKPWSVEMPAHYGYVKRTVGGDGENVDVYLGENPTSDTVAVVDQINPKTGDFDEHKAFVGFDNPDQVLSTYDAAFSDHSGPRRRGGAVAMSMDQFKDWLKSGNTKKPINEQNVGVDIDVKPDDVGGPKKIGDDVSTTAAKPHLGQPEVFDDSTAEVQRIADRGSKTQTWILDNGRKTGHEYTVATRPDGSIAMAGTSNEKGGVRFTLDAMQDLNRPGSNLRIEHNHPLTAAISNDDVEVLAWPGAGLQVAISHDGAVSGASLSDAVRSLRDQYGRESVGKLLRQAYGKAYALAREHVNDLLAQELTMRALGQSGLVEYYSSHPMDHKLQPLVDDISSALKEAYDNAGLPEIHENATAGVHRPPAIGSAQGTLAAISQRHAEMAAGQRASPAGDSESQGSPQRGDQGAQVPTIRQGNTPEDRSDRDLASTPLTDTIRAPDGRPATASEIAAEASRLARMPRDSTLGKLRKTFSYITLPVSLASKDRLSANLFGAVMDRFRRLNALENEAVPQASPYFKLKQPAMHRVNQVMEVARLYGMDLSDDGRSIVLQVPEQRAPFGSPRPELSRPGQVLALSPDETAAYHSLKGFFQNRLTQMGEALARSRGYDGEFTRPAIQAAIDRAESRGAKAAATRAMHAFDMTEEMRRAGYVPFNRYGDYYVKVRAIDPASGDQGGLWFVPKQSVFQDVQVKMDGSNEQIPVREKVTELRRQYPADRFHIETGKTEALGGKNVLMQANIPQLEKIFMMLDRPGTDASAAVLDDLMDKLFEARKAGFRKQAQNTRGYSIDFERSIADYIRQSSAHVSNMEHRNSIDTARTAIDDHPDKNIRSFWDNYMRDLDTPDGPVSQALRKVGFFQFIWGSFASAATNILQTPGVTLPALSAWAGPRTPILLGEAMTEAANAITVGSRGFTIDWSKIGRTDAERAAIKRARNEGVMDPRMSEEAQGKNVTSSQRLRPYAKRMGHVWDAGASMFSTAESINRIAAWLSHFRAAQNPQLVESFSRAHAQDQNFQRMRRAGGLTPENIARFGVEDTQFIGGKVNRAPITRGPGAWLLQFKPYLMNYLRIFHRMATRMGWHGKMAFSLGMGALVAQSGLFGLPYAQDVTDLGEWIYKQFTGIDPMIETRLKQLADDSALGPLGGELVGHGLGRMGPVDISGRTSMGDIVPDGNPLDLFPLASGTVGRGMQFWNQMSQGRPWTAWADASGAVIGKGGEDIAKAAALAKEGYATQKGNVVEFPSQVTKTQIAGRALGFQPSDLSKELEQRAEANRMKESTTAASSKLLTDVSRELALAQDATRSGNKAEADAHYARYTALIKANAAQLADPNVPGWEKVPPIRARAIKAAIIQQMNYDQSVLSRTSKLKRGAVQSIQGAP